MTNSDQKQIDIDLNQITHPDVKVMVGHPSGAFKAEQTNILQAIEIFDVINVIVPDRMYSVSVTFLLGFMDKAAQKIGAEKVKQMFVFKSKLNISESVSEAFRMLGRTKTALDV